MPHLMDVTMFWSPHSGGIRRYIQAKRDWVRGVPDGAWHHTLAVPVAPETADVSLGGVRLPGTGGYRVPLGAHRLVQGLIDIAPDVVEIGDPFTTSGPAIRAANRMGIPVVAFCHANMVAMAQRWGGPWAADQARRHLCKIYKQCDLLLAPSPSMVSQLQNWGLAQAELQLLGVDTEVFCPERRDPRWRQEMGVAPDDIVLLYAGRFAPEKNLSTLARAVDLMGAPYRLVCVGDGPLKPRGERVQLAPFTNDRLALARAMASSDLLVHAGDQETFGLSVLEAMACGTPVVARASAGLLQLVDTHVGQLVNGPEAHEFARAIADTAQREPTMLRHEARARALRYSWHTVLPGLFRRYEALLQNKNSTAWAVNQAITAAKRTSLG